MLECVLWAGNVNFDFPISSIGFDHSATLLPSASFTVISEPRRISFCNVYNGEGAEGRLVISLAELRTESVSPVVGD